MSSIQIELFGIVATTTLACVLPGTFLLLRGVALMSDAISHAILPGIVIMFMVIGQLHSPLLILGACLAGIATVVLTETIIQTDRLKKDAALGLVFPFFFSIGVILISVCARTIHLDMDSVIIGHLIFAPFTRLSINGVDYGAQALWTMSAIALINACLAYVACKELTLSTFDPLLASMLGFRPRIIYYALMIMTSITCICAFDSVGAIVVVALMIVPPATAFLLARSIQELLILAAIFGLHTAWGGFLLAHTADVSIAGSLATASGCILLLTGILYNIITRLKIARIHQLPDIHLILLCSLIADTSTHHSIQSLSQALGWSEDRTKKIVDTGCQLGFLKKNLLSLHITDKGILFIQSWAWTT